MLENIEIGTMGWACEGNFYPPDLPEDWHLDYYANYFSAMLVPQRIWTQWNRDEAEGFLESADTLRWCGLGVRTPLEEEEEVALAQWILTRLQENGMATGMLSHVALPPQLHDVTAVTWLDAPEAAPKTGWCWHNLQGAPLGWVTQLPDDVRDQRVLLEDFARHLPEGTTGAPFIVRDGCANMDRMTAFKQLAEWLGL